MTEVKTTRRAYVRLSPKTWAGICATWETGEATLEELATLHSVNKRTLQAHFAKHGSVKGSAAGALSAAVKAAVFEDTFWDCDSRVALGKQARLAAYDGAVKIDKLIHAQLDLATKDLASAHKALSAVKLLAMAAQAIERTQALKWRALGLDQDHEVEQLPEIHIKDFSEPELAELQLRAGDSIDPFGTSLADEPVADEGREEGGDEPTDNSDIVSVH